MNFVQRFGAAWKEAAGTKNPAASSAVSESSRLPKPGKNGGGSTPSWRQNLQGMLYFLGQIEPIRIEEAKEGIDNSVVGICITWITTSWLMGVPQVGTVSASGEFTPLAARHPLLDALETSANGADEYSNLMQATVTDYIRHGNAYWHRLKRKDGSIGGYEWLPARCVKPIPDEKGALKEYEYTVDSPIKLNPEEVIHFKYGSQANNPLLGISPLAAQYREIVTDNAYSDYSAGLAKGGGMPQVVFSPKQIKTADGETTVDITQEEAALLMEDFNAKLESQPGKTRMISGAVDMHKMGINPDEMALNEVRAMPETRIPAALGLPSILLQLYTGMERSKFDNMTEAIKQGWRGCIIPMMQYFARRITTAGLHQFKGAKESNLAFRWDTSKVPELAEDKTQQYADSREDFKAGIITLDEARTVRNLATTPKIKADLKPKPETAPTTEKPATGQKSFVALKAPAQGVSLDTAIADYRMRLREREDEAVADIKSALGVVETHILRALDDLLSRMDEAAESGETVNESWLEQEARFLLLLEEIRTQYEWLGNAVAPAIGDAQRATIEQSVESSLTMARASLGATPPDILPIRWHSLPVSTLEALVGAASDGSPLADLFAEIAPDAVQGIRNALYVGVGSGYSAKKTSALIREAVGNRVSMSRARAETIARTEMLRAGREATRRTYEANGDVLDGWIWKAANDTRACACCWAMDGTLFDTNQKMDGHPNCRCCMVPRTKSWAELTGDSSLADTRPSIEPGEAIFSRLSYAKQTEILGESLFALYHEGEITLPDCVVRTENVRWGTMRRAADVEEAKANAAKRKGGI